MGKILVVDDDRRINELMVDIFTMEGYETLYAFNGEEAIEILDNVPDVDVVILDIMMPKIDGWDSLAYIKTHYDVKVIMLTALDDEEYEVRGIRSGADDYITKPFKRAVLLERVRRLITTYKERTDTKLVSGPLTLIKSECRAYLDAEPIRLTTKEFQLLMLLMQNSRHALSRETILDKVWGYEYDGNDRTIDTHIKMIRHSLKDYDYVIRTIRGMGYSFDAEVIEK